MGKKRKVKRKRSMASLKREALKTWGAVILKRDPTCRVCKRGPSRNPHHLFPRSRYRHLWFDLRNGVGLCTSCHYRIHYDPVIPVLKIVDEMGNSYGHLELDAALGRRRNPYKRVELENIIVALNHA